MLYILQMADCLHVYAHVPIYSCGIQQRKPHERLRNLSFSGLVSSGRDTKPSISMSVWVVSETSSLDSRCDGGSWVALLPSRMDGACVYNITSRHCKTLQPSACLPGVNKNIVELIAFQLPLHFLELRLIDELVSAQVLLLSIVPRKVAVCRRSC